MLRPHKLYCCIENQSIVVGGLDFEAHRPMITFWFYLQICDPGQAFDLVEPQLPQI